jgi:hypothetical protein
MHDLTLGALLGATKLKKDVMLCHLFIVESRSALDRNTSCVIVVWDTPGEEFYSMFFLRVPSKKDLEWRQQDNEKEKEQIHS